MQQPVDDLDSNETKDQFFNQRRECSAVIVD